MRNTRSPPESTIAALSGAIIAIVTAVATGLRALAGKRRVGAARDHAVEAVAAFRTIADGINTPEWDPKRQDRVRTERARAAARLAIDGYTELALARRPAGKWVLIVFLASLLGRAVAAVLILQGERAALVGLGFIMLGVSTALGNVTANLLEKWLVSKRRIQAASEQDATNV